jgi:putative nucleotidyltransferase with HDIG domain
VRIGYRVRQFSHALTAAPGPQDLEQVRQALSPRLANLFLQLQASEQAHSLQVYRQLRDRGQADPDLLAAALLHDVGKSRFRLRLWERVAIVLGKALLSAQVRRWGQGAPRGWKRPFVIAEQHAAWGAEMAARCGATPLTVTIIRRHQDALRPPWSRPEDALLYQLQIVDDES